MVDDGINTSNNNNNNNNPEGRIVRSIFTPCFQVYGLLALVRGERAGLLHRDVRLPALPDAGV